jgi:hypothetical protein
VYEPGRFHDPPRFSNGRVGPYGSWLLPVCCPAASLTRAVDPCPIDLICAIV